MAAMTTMDPTLTLQIHKHNAIVEEIKGLIRVYKDGHVERPPVVPCVNPSLPPELGVTCGDTIIDKGTGIWARVYVPNTAARDKLPLLLYFHGGGFCVGSAAWSCYHDFLAKLASKSSSVIVSVNYRLAPENPLPAAYDDGVKAMVWLRQQEFSDSSTWWAKKVNFSAVYLGGDSAGGNIAFHVALRKPIEMKIKGLVLIQPFFGGETRTSSEYRKQAAGSALTVGASDAYWRMSLPAGANRDHQWCNPKGLRLEQQMRILVCIAEMDILKDRNMEFSESLGMEKMLFNGVGHAFQVLDKSSLSQTRTLQLINRVSDFVNYL